jgi:precorrin-2 C(20)-methyltransferase
MAVSRKMIEIVGCGPGAADYLTDAARKAVSGAELLAGSRRLLELFADYRGEKLLVDAHVGPLVDQLEAAWRLGRKVAVLVSGDPGLYSLAERLLRRFGRENCRVTPAVSSVQAAFARLGLAWDNVRVISAHGRVPDGDVDLSQSDKLAVLGGTREAMHWAAATSERLRETHVAYLCENLTLPGQRVRQLTPEELMTQSASSLAIVVLVRAQEQLRVLPHDPVGNTLCGVPGVGKSDSLDLPRNATEGVPYRGEGNAVTRLGTLYGIGVGPGDPEWITVKGARTLAACRQVFVPRSGDGAQSVALQIARCYLKPDAVVRELLFPMTSDRRQLHESWQAAARQVLQPLEAGEDCCFLTLGDAMFYSTYVFLLDELCRLRPELPIVTIPGVTAYSAAAAITATPVGRQKQLLTIVPASDDLGQLAAALDRGGTVVLMKIGHRLQSVLDLLEGRGLLAQGVFVAHAGMSNQLVETDLVRLRGLPKEAGYLSLMIIQAPQPPSLPASPP